MKTVAISTIHPYYLLSNYGSFWQHYALRKVVASFGFVPFRVYDPKEKLSFWARCRKQAKDLLRPLYRRVIRRVDDKALSATDYCYRRLNRLFLRDYKVLMGRFYEKPRFNADTVGIRGGDQVFYPDTPYRWMADVKEGNPLIAYAASADWVALREHADWQAELARPLARCTALGIREQEGVALARQLASPAIEVRQVADPVQLLTVEDFRSVQSQKPVFAKPTLFCYVLNVKSAEDLRLAQYEELARELGCELKIASIQGAERFIPPRYRLLLSPREFLRALDDSTAIVTNSFHATLFASIYNKNFLTVKQRCAPGTDQNMRQKEFLALTHLAKRFVANDLSVQEIRQVLASPVDWSLVNLTLAERRADSIDWLKKALRA